MAPRVALGAGAGRARARRRQHGRAACGRAWRVRDARHQNGYFAAYRDGRYAPYADAFEDDAEVAVVHGPSELGSRPLTVALVDVRDALARAWRRGRIGAAGRDAVLRAARDIHFAERSVERLTARTRDALRGDEADAAIAAIAHGPSRKARDAIGALDAAARLLAKGPPAPRPRFALEPALVWEHFRQATDRADRLASAARRDVAAAARVTAWPPDDRRGDTAPRWARAMARAGAGRAKARP